MFHWNQNFFGWFRKDRLIQRAPGGGVCILVNRNSIASDLNVTVLNNHLYEDSVWCEIKCEGKPIIIGVVYRTPSSHRENNDLLLDLFNICDTFSDKAQILVCGYFSLEPLTGKTTVWTVKVNM